MQTTTKFYLNVEEEVPCRSYKIMKFIVKVMFLAVVARPFWDHNRKSYFNEKLRIWFFVFQTLDKMNNEKYPKEILLIKSMEFLNKEEITKIMLKTLTCTVREKQSKRIRNGFIYLQQTASDR